MNSSKCATRCGHSTSDFLGKVRAPLMLIYGEFEKFVRISECLGLLINVSLIALEFILWIFYLLWCVTEICAR